MKQILFLIYLIVAVPLMASDVILSWDANDASENVAGYAVFSRDYTHGYDYNSPLWSGSSTTCTVTVPNDKQTAFVARAWKYGPYDLQGNRLQVWSDNSNEVIHTPSVTPPSKPSNVITRILQAVLDFFGVSWDGYFEA